MDMPKGRERARAKWGKEAAYYSGLLCPKHLICWKTPKMNTGPAGSPLKSGSGVVIWQGCVPAPDGAASPHERPGRSTGLGDEPSRAVPRGEPPA